MSSSHNKSSSTKLSSDSINHILNSLQTKHNDTLNTFRNIVGMKLSAVSIDSSSLEFKYLKNSTNTLLDTIKDFHTLGEQNINLLYTLSLSSFNIPKSNPQTNPFIPKVESSSSSSISSTPIIVISPTPEFPIHPVLESSVTPEVPVFQESEFSTLTIPETNSVAPQVENSSFPSTFSTPNIVTSPTLKFSDHSVLESSVTPEVPVFQESEFSALTIPETNSFAHQVESISSSSIFSTPNIATSSQLSSYKINHIPIRDNYSYSDYLFQNVSRPSYWGRNYSPCSISPPSYWGRNYNPCSISLPSYWGRFL